MPLVVVLASFVLLAQQVDASSTQAAVNCDCTELSGAVEREIGAGQEHCYELLMHGAAYLRVRVEQLGINLILDALDPNGRAIAEVDNPSGRFATETLSLISETAGRYQLRVRAPTEPTGSGSYRILIDEERMSCDGDWLRIAAERAEAAADRHYHLSTAESFGEALAGYRDALARWQKAEAPGEVAEMHYRIGHVLRLLGESRTALESLDQALAQQRQLEDLPAQAATLNQIGLVHWVLGDGEKAIAVYQEALAIWQATGSVEHQARVLNNLGVASQAMGRPRRAMAHFQQAAAALAEAGDTRRQAIAVTNLGTIHDGLGEPLLARDAYQKALSLARSCGDRRTEALALSNLGVVNEEMGAKQTALAEYATALQLLRELGDRRGLATALSNLGSLHHKLGNERRALDLFEQALAHQRAIDARGDEASTLNNVGRALLALGELEKAKEAFFRALEIQQKLFLRSGEVMTMSNLGSLYLEAGQPTQAASTLEQALLIVAELGDRGEEAVLLCRLGQACIANGDFETGMEHLRRALELKQALADPEDQVRVLREMARAELDRGRLEEARALLEPALHLVEDLRIEIAGNHLRASYFATLREVHELYLELLMTLHRRQPEAGYAELAFEVAEQARARSLLDVVRQAGLRQGGAGDAALDELQRLRIRIKAKMDRQIRLLSREHTAAEAEEAQREVEELLAEYELAAARTQDPAVDILDHEIAGTVKLSRLQTHFLDDETVLLEYALGRDRSYLWAVGRESLAVVELPGRAEIESAVTAAFELLSTPEPGRAAEEQQILRSLSSMLLGPVAPMIPGKRLLIVADGALHYLPFAALPTPPAGGRDSAAAWSLSEPLVVHHELVFLPSASVLQAMRSAAAPDSAATGALVLLADPVFTAGDPRLQEHRLVRERALDSGPQSQVERSAEQLGGLERLLWSRYEAEQIAGLAGDARVLQALGFAANLETMLGPEVAEGRVLHIATHGLLNSEEPELSGLVLSLYDAEGRSREGFLSLHDIYGLRLRAGLVVLSGCRTALGKQIRGEGLIGLTRGFLCAGASRVVASLWSVRDRATAELAERFYRGMLEEELSPAAALRQAQVAMWRQRQWRDPYFWAAFIMQGDWQGRPL